MEGRKRVYIMRALEERYMLDGALVETAALISSPAFTTFDDTSLDLIDVDSKSQLTTPDTNADRSGALSNLFSDIESQEIFHNFTFILPIGFSWELSLDSNQNWSTQGASLMIINTSQRDASKPLYGYMSDRSYILPLDIIIDTMKESDIQAFVKGLTFDRHFNESILPFFGESYNPELQSESDESTPQERSTREEKNLITQGYKQYHDQNGANMFNQPRYHINGKGMPALSVVQYDHIDPFENSLKEKEPNIYDTYSQKIFPELLLTQFDLQNQQISWIENPEFTTKLVTEEQKQEHIKRVSDYQKSINLNNLPFFQENESSHPAENITSQLGMKGFIEQVQSYADYFDNERQRVESHVKNISASSSEEEARPSL